MRKSNLRANKKTGPEITQRLAGFSAEVDTVAIREETFNGTDYLVVPVVALVEGVLQGMNAPAPELAPAAAFAKFPDGWNGRPLVMNHPVNSEGSPVSANSTAAMESSAFGLIFNTRSDGNKLKTEAWVDIARATQKGGEFLSTLERIRAGEMVEVSTGCYVTTMQKKGVFNGRSYESVWIEVVPDHLAFLSEGVKGACSIEDGCGTPRSNEMPKKRTPMKGKPKGYKGPKDGDENENANEPSNHAECGCGNHSTSKSACTCTDKKPAVQKLTAQQQADRDQRILEAEIRAETYRAIFDVNAVPDTLLSRDVEKVVSRALKDLHTGRNVSCFLVGYTANSAVYEMIEWDVPSSSWDFFQIPMDVSADGKVTFNGEPKEVNLLTRIVSANEATENDMTTTPKANTAADTTAQPADTKTPKTEADTTAGTPPAEATATSPATNSQAAAPAAPKALSAQEYIDQAPPGVREALQEQMRTHEEKKTGIIKALKDSGRCTFSDDELKAMSIPSLEKLLKLADVPDYSGIALPGRTDNLSQNQGADLWAAPPAPNCYAAPETKQ